jgi:Protein of unknown function (DUF1614)
MGSPARRSFGLMQPVRTLRDRRRAAPAEGDLGMLVVAHHQQYRGATGPGNHSTAVLGSAVNLPVARLPAEIIRTARVVTVFGMPYLLPEVEERPGTLVAVNPGGAIVPASLAGYLIVHNGLGWQALLAVAIITAVVHRLTRPIPGLGIAVPALLPALIAAGMGLVITPAAAPALASVAGVLGTLLGADVLNLRRVRALGTRWCRSAAPAPSTASTSPGSSLSSLPACDGRQRTAPATGADRRQTSRCRPSADG